MKAVNLIPAEERRSGGSGVLADVSGPTRGLLGALVLALIAALAYVTLANQVAERETRLAAVERTAAAAEQRAAALKTYGDVAELRDRSLATVRSLAAERFDWPGLLADVSRRVPADVTLVALSGTAAATQEATVADAPSAGPTVQLSGCTSDHTAVARVMDRLAAIPGVDDVQLGSSNTTGAGSGSGAGEGGCPRRDQFQLSLLLAGAPSAPAAPVAPEVPAE